MVIPTPTPEVIRTVVRITLNAFPTEMNENRNQLVVRKVGLPPLLVSPAESFHTVSVAPDAGFNAGPR